ncbi:alpha/beta hydrolase [Colletotrichum tofieldiae]|uniref:Alpha/beta hydrolase n=1 Tax=Colletotrichum tofieldiae TaxID=708197 RepID=A0A161W3S7_9PEZI|nr:alpha/beta hydrolase [Colletotrichum tofieldiae]GKT57517.1 alpha/beta hydrolase [Colletotrichum tofieldiae]GKT77085.1 alpha/beta hydrolase [Colletotrichum tofieldiae]
MRDRILESHHLGLGLAAAAAAAATTYLLLASHATSSAAAAAPRPANDRRKTARSPKWTVLPTLSTLGRDELPYPPDALPGGRDVATAYGNLRVYEFGPEDAQERVLLLHGIGTPCLALGSVAGEFVEKGWRVMTFDFFGRGYSDAPLDIPHDARLYTTQVLLALASSSLPGWTGNDAFHLLGYSLGGAIAAAFASSHPHLIKSLTLVAPGGLVRSAAHVGWRSRVLYNSEWIPEGVRRWFVGRRIMPADPKRSGDVPEKETVDNADDEGETAEWDELRLVGGRRIGEVVRWQMQTHPGYVRSYMSTIRHAPVYDRGDEEWRVLGEVLGARRRGAEPGLRKGRVLFVLGETDDIVVPGETVWDAETVLGEDAVEVVVLKGGHEVAITKGREIVGAVVSAWAKSG